MLVIVGTKVKLDYLKKKNIKEEVIFISSNSKDFFTNDKKNIEFHPDLWFDILQKEIKTLITPFKTLYDFVNSKLIDKTIHSIDHFSHDFDEYIAYEGKEFLETFDYKGETIYFKSYPEYIVKFLNIIDVFVEIDEGLEDTEILNVSKLKDNELYINYRYNLRRVSITFEINQKEYYTYKNEIDTYYYNKEFIDDSVYITMQIRPHFDVSFIYNTKDDYSDSFTVDSIYFGN